MSLFNSCIYSGFVTHRRFKPKRHFFSYKTFSLLIDLNEIENLGKEINFFSYNKFNILSFYDVDHGPRDGNSLIPWVKSALANAKINIGSGNIGATNVLRTGNKYLALVTLILDVLKGYVPVIVTKYFFPEFLQISALLVFLGHIFPFWLKFKGGKGVATYLGILIALSYGLGVLFIFTWLVVSLIFKYSSLSSIFASFSLSKVNIFIYITYDLI